MRILRHLPSIAFALATAVAFPASQVLAQAGTLRGVVTDTSGRPMPGVEVFSVSVKRSTRSAADGRFVLAKLPFGQQLIIARLPGYQPAEQSVSMLDDATPPITFRLRRVLQALDTMRIVSQDGCSAFDFAGFGCRRRAAFGQFRGADELKALRPLNWADMFEGIEGLRRVPSRHPVMGVDWTVTSTVRWSCLKEGWNGRDKTAGDAVLLPKDIVGLEYYDVYEKVPSAYKRMAWPDGSKTPCSFVMYWTRDYVDSKKP